MKSCKTYILCALFGLFAASQAMAQSIVGAWSADDPSKEGAAVMAFFANGTFFYIENVARAEAPDGYPGYERGTYTWNPATNAFTLNLLQDLNGNTGAGGASGLAGMTATIVGNTLTLLAPGLGQLVGTRVTGSSPIVGAWGVGSTLPNESAVIVFLPSGIYFMAEDGDSSAATGDPTGHDGIEVGTYSWNAATGAMTSSRTPFPYIDTNGEWGLSHVKAGTTFKVSPDGSTLTVTEGADVIVLPRSGAASPPAALNFQAIWWNAAESGWGLNLAHQGDTIFASWFTYDPKGRGWWLVMSAQKTGANTYVGDLYETHGPAFDAVPFLPGNVTSSKVGTGTLAFTDAGNGTFTYTVSKGGSVTQTKTLTRQSFGPLPTCTFGAQPNLALATNYQDIWWAKPAGSESGWGINLNHQGDTIFATWFTYDHDGSPLWLVVTAPKTGPGTFEGDLYQTTGPPFNAIPFSSALVVPVKVGTAKFTFGDGNNATFAYTVKLSDMPAAVSQTKAITREVFTTPGTTCQ